jgi:hypothetical protein
MANFDQQNQNVYHQINQVINQHIINNYIIDDDIVEDFVEHLTDLLPYEANQKVKRALILHIIFECSSRGDISIPPEKLSLIIDKLKELSPSEFDKLLSSDKKYKKLRNRLGWYIVVAAGGGYVIGKANIEKIVDELAHNVSLYFPEINYFDSNDSSSNGQQNSKGKQQINNSSENEEARKEASRFARERLYRENELIKREIVDYEEKVTQLRLSGKQIISESANREITTAPDTAFLDKDLSSQAEIDINKDFDINPDCIDDGLDFDTDCVSDGLDIDTEDLGCFIATAVYGSYDSHQVIALRNFRDNILLSHALGNFIVAIYYKVSPYLAKWIVKYTLLTQATRYLLDKFISYLDER